MPYLYEKHTSPSGRVTYRPLAERRVEIDAELANAFLLTLIGATIVNMETNLQPHSRALREIQTIEKSLRTISAGQDLDPSMYPLAWGALNAALAFLEEEAGAAVKQ
ncbi:MAG: hypothetical protein RBT64_10405 [Trichloromonas sp.]|jgi:hypothetical protein|nr:hypothetical protein [Trichloromonas sp.]